jgi:hypothetical protein
MNCTLSVHPVNLPEIGRILAAMGATQSSGKLKHGFENHFDFLECAATGIRIKSAL